MGFVYKIARTKEEFAKIHALNYKTFVKEIPQHSENKSEILVDSFHEENTYLICLKGDQLIGMIAIRGNRPFSLDKKLGNMEKYLPIKLNNPCEIRLLSVEKNFRNGRVFLGLTKLLARYSLKEGYDSAVISGTTRQVKLYEQLGFKPFAFLIGTSDAQYQPMYLTKQAVEELFTNRISIEPISFLPGPVNISDDVNQALLSKPISHRSNSFFEKMKAVRKILCHMTNSANVQVLMGSGTLANDVIAQQLTLLDGKGLILVSGEFGNRLVDHARRAGLSFHIIEKEWGEQISIKEIEKELYRVEYSWLWTVHCETSTGMIFHLEQLSDMCKRNNVKLCLDCISTIGVMSLNLENVYLASGVSGKAIGAFTGLSFVFYNDRLKKGSTIPRYLDLAMYDENDSIPYSHSSNLIESLLQALAKFETDEQYKKIEVQYNLIRDELEKLGLPILTEREYSSPGILTIVIPNDLSSKKIGDDLYLQGFQLHYESNYLELKNWIQIACMNLHSREDIWKMIKAFKIILNEHANLSIRKH